MSNDTIDQAAVMQVLNDFLDPDKGLPVTKLDLVSDVTVDGNNLSLTLAQTSFVAPLHEQTKTEMAALLKAKLPTLDQVTINLKEHIRPADKLGQIGLTAKSVIAVGSGKGGVGKSTVAASLALGFAKYGCKVGLMDADIYGPSVPHLFGVNERPLIDQESKKIIPQEADGLKLMSMGFLVPPGEAVVWRGPMLHGAITQFLRDTDWGELDYLIIDMPPGTGDISLTLSQLLPLTGAVAVCTPQEVALIDATKAIAMFEKVKIPVLGMVENMSYFLCPDNDKRYDIFGHGGAKSKAEELKIPFLGEIPINMKIREYGDQGKSSANFDDQEIANYYLPICQKLVNNIAQDRKEQPPLPSLSVLG